MTKIMKSLDELYEYADENRVEVYSFGLAENQAMSYMDGVGDCYIAIDPMILTSGLEEKMKLSHEMGHCMTGSMYGKDTPLIDKWKHEARARHWEYTRLVPLDELHSAFHRGITEPWELAEYFDVPEDYIQRAYNYYQTYYSKERR